MSRWFALAALLCAAPALAHDKYNCKEALEVAETHVALCFEAANECNNNLAVCLAQECPACPDVTVVTSVLKCRKVLIRPNGDRIGKGCILATEAR